MSEIRSVFAPLASFKGRTERLGLGEFVFLAGSLTALYAVSIDAVVPALGAIGDHLGVSPNQGQLLITALIVGMAVGQLFYGPISDSLGRKPALYLALSIFAIGSLICLFAADFRIMIAGRVLQGLGSGGSRTITVALIRDQYLGAAMARIMSFMSAIFVVISLFGMIAAQAALNFSSWTTIFVGLLIFDLAACAWLANRQPETHPKEKRATFSIDPIIAAGQSVFSCKTAMGYTLALGLVLGGWIGYLNSARQIFQEIYQVGTWFPLYFAVGGVAYAAAAVLNARLVRTVALKTLGYAAILAIGLVSVALSVYCAWVSTPPVQVFLLYVFVVFSCFGLAVSNLLALSMEPLGQIAGVAAGVINSLSWLSGAVFGMIIGQLFNGSTLPVTVGFAVVCAAALLVLRVIPASSESAV